MSLQVWLPLNGNLQNKGLADINVTNHGTTVDNNGKIGKCYSFNGTNNYITVPVNVIKDLTKDFSFCFWVKFLSFNTSYQTVFSATASNASWANEIICFQRNASTNYFLFTVANGSSYTATALQTGTLATNTWYHFVCTYQTSGRISIYQNGNLINSYTISFTPGVDKIQNFNLGRSHTGYYSNMLLNDFRIYNHALSKKEIKEISKALILHYPLDDNGLGNPNLITKSTFEQAPWKTAIQGITEYKKKNTILLAFHTLYNNTSHGSTTIFPNITFKENTQYTLSWFWRDDYRTDGLVSSFYIRIFHTDGTYIQAISSNGDSASTQWAYRTLTSTSGKTVASVRVTYGRGGTIAISDLKLEEGNKATQWTPASQDYNQNIIYDTSGYQNNKTPTDLSYSIDTIKYQACTNFNGNTSVISLGNISNLLQNQFTVNLWFKKSELGSKNYETLFGGPSGFEIDTRAGSSSTLSLYMTSTRGGTVFSPFNFNQWYMVTMVNDGTNELYYINGELKKTIEKKAMPNGNYFIGSWGSATSQNYKGLISDFRLYTTALSEEDILQLYHTSAEIDKNQNVYIREIRE